MKLLTAGALLSTLTFSQAYAGDFNEACERFGKEDTAVAAILKVTGSQTCLQAHQKLLTLSSLDLQQKGIKETEALESLAAYPNLTDLSVYSNYGIKTLDSIAKITQLKKLNIGSMDTESGDPLANLTNLEELRSVGNKWKSIDFMASMKNLKLLDIEPVETKRSSQEAYAVLSELTELEHFEQYALRGGLGCPDFPMSALKDNHKLTFIRTNHDIVPDLSPLEGLKNLKTLRLSGSARISSVDALAGLTNLEVLSLSNLKSPDISGLKNLVNMRQLSIGSNRIQSIDALANMTKLEHLGIGFNKIEDISVVANMKALKTFTSHGNPIRDLSPLKGATLLEKIDLSADLGGVFTEQSFDFLSNMTELKEMRLDDFAYVRDLEALKKLKKLSRFEMRCSSCYLPTLAGLESLESLKYLNLEYVRLDNLKAIAQNESVEYVDLRSSKIDSLETLRGDRSVQKLYIGENKFSDTSPLLSMKALKKVDLGWSNEGGYIGTVPMSRNFRARLKRWQKKALMPMRALVDRGVDVFFVLYLYNRMTTFEGSASFDELIEQGKI